MLTILAVLVATAQPVPPPPSIVAVNAAATIYAAKVRTFGCNSVETVAKLQDMRSDRNAFQMALYEQIFHGQCVEFAKDTVLQGSIEPSQASILRVNAEVDPPGYMAPLADFELKPAGAKP